MNSSLMIRLIDVALIILLGFVAISRLKTEYVDLSTAQGERITSAARTHRLTVHVHKDYYLVEDAAKRVKCATLDKLENLLREKQRGTTLQVIVEPQKRSIMQKLVDVLDVCQRNGIEKLLNYESIH